MNDLESVLAVIGLVTCMALAIATVICAIQGIECMLKHKHLPAGESNTEAGQNPGASRT
jgi:hypothetical protein